MQITVPFAPKQAQRELMLKGVPDATLERIELSKTILDPELVQALEAVDILAISSAQVSGVMLQWRMLVVMLYLCLYLS